MIPSAASKTRSTTAIDAVRRALASTPSDALSKASGSEADGPEDVLQSVNFLPAIVIGLVQGLTQLFPISCLGHTVLVPSWIGSI